MSHSNKSNKTRKNISIKSPNLFKTLLNLWPYMWPEDQPSLKKRIIWASVLLVFSKLVLIAVPYFFKYITDALENSLQSPKWLPSILISPFILILAYNVARIFQAGLNQLRDSLFASVGQNAVRKLARRTFVHMHQLSLSFHLERRTGGLSRIIDRGIKGIEAIVRFSILNTAPTLLECIVSALIVWLSYGWYYFSIVVITIALYTWFTVVASNWRMAIRRDMNQSDTEANTRAIDSLLNFETVKYFCNEEMEMKRFDTSMAHYETAAIKIWISLGWLNFGQAVIFGIGMCILMLLSAYEIMHGQKTIGDFVFINSLLIQLSIPLNFVGFIYREMRQGFTDIEHMFDLLNITQMIHDKPAAPTLIVRRAAIRFENVVFGYDTARPILKEINFEIPAGKKIAIVGPSGAGKSTITRLLFRFYDISEGRIMFDGQDIRDVTQRSLRKVIGIVPQDTVLFNDTIAYNIRYGRPDASDEEVQEAASLSRMSDFIKSLPDGYNSIVGERGLKLSGGEKQRIAIARTILKSPSVLIFDEATSALDTETEREIQQSIDLISNNRTTLVIAHRLSTTITADEILVLKNGSFIEHGRHEQLLSLGGLYASMWKCQLEATQVEEQLRKL